MQCTHFIAIFLVVVSFILLSSSTSSLLQFHPVTTGSSSSISSSTSSCLASFGQYNGHQYKSPGSTIGEGKCLVQSKWMQLMQHKVKINKDTIIDDWLFINYHDRINVLVKDPESNDDNDHFLILRQTKYALEGKESLAIVGGIIEPNEDASSAAKREVNEELGLDCEFKFLGRFRTDVNRGMGWVNSYLAYDCQKKKVVAAASASVGSGDEEEEVGTKDVERQDVISMSIDDVMQNVKEGKFVEVQWSNTVALAMLELRS